MRDEHLIYTDLGSGRIKIIPEEGYDMICTLTNQPMSEAITTQRKIKYFVSMEEKHND